MPNDFITTLQKIEPMELTEKETRMLDRLSEYVYDSQVSNEFLVQLIELAGSFSHLQTIPDYAKEKKLTYNGVKKTRQIRTIFNIKLVIDNE